MSMPVPVYFDPSQFPEALEREFVECLKERRIDPKFHYLTPRQASRWLALHQTYSPSRHDSACGRMYEKIFEGVASDLPERPVQVIGLGSGGGTKDLMFLRAMQQRDFSLRYVPSDASPSLSLVSQQRITKALHDVAVRPLVADLLRAKDLNPFWADGAPEGERRFFSFLGMVPNLPPRQALERIRSWMRTGDEMIVSANLAPGTDYSAGCRAVLPQYDNPLTARWLGTVLEDLDLEPDSFTIRFGIEPSPDLEGLFRIFGKAKFRQDVTLEMAGQSFAWRAGSGIDLFYSNRFTPELMQSLLEHVGFNILARELVESEEEGVWRCEF